MSLPRAIQRLRAALSLFVDISLLLPSGFLLAPQAVAASSPRAASSGNITSENITTEPIAGATVNAPRTTVAPAGDLPNMALGNGALTAFPMTQDTPSDSALALLPPPVLPQDFVQATLPRKEYWIVTTPDGTKYRFGGEIDPETGVDQNSVWYATVYNYRAAICGNFPYDLCDKAWRWNLDRVEDTNGNLTTYNYATEINYYGARGMGYSTSSIWRRDYVRSDYLTRIEYGRRVGETGPYPTQVEFVAEERCEGACSWPSSYPDTPGDLTCSGTSGVCWNNTQSFWSRKRLDYVEPQVYNQSTSSWQAVACYDLDYSFPTAPTDPQGDGSERKLFLNNTSWWEKLWSGLTSSGGGSGSVETCTTYPSSDVPKSIARCMA